MEKYAKKFGFRSILAPALQEDIDKVESEWGVRLPSEYTDFLREWNGGVFCDERDPIFDTGENYRELVLLYGVGPYPAEGVHLLSQSSQEGYGFRERVPDRFLAIGHGQPFEKICMSIKGEDKGKIFFWYPGGEIRETDVPTMEFLSLIGDDFFDFWNKLIKGGTYECE